MLIDVLQAKCPKCGHEQPFIRNLSNKLAFSHADCSQNCCSNCMYPLKSKHIIWKTSVGDSGEDGI